MKQRIALVHGANRGIGFEISRQLAEKGWLVYLAGRDLKRSAEAAAKLQKSAYKVRAIQSDVSAPKSIEQTAKELASQIALNAVTRQLSAALQSKNISVNSVCPGGVCTHMDGAGAQRTPAEGADAAVWLATEASQNLTGQFLRDRKTNCLVESAHSVQVF